MKGMIACFALLIVASAVSAQDTAGYDLPNVLKTTSGHLIINKAEWEKQRRPEIQKLFEDNVYGQEPRSYDSIKYAITTDVKNAMAGKAHLKVIMITIWKGNKHVDIYLTLFIPNKKHNPPVFLFMNNRANNNTDAIKQIKSGFWPAEMAIDSGYAMASFNVGDAAPDNNDNYMTGVLQLYPEQLTADNGMKAIDAWAWGASRAMDYLKTDKDIDFNKVAIVGHSRGGKAALWAGATDQRFAMVIANCSGSTGAALSRKNTGETVKRINTHFPYWFNNNYKKYNDDVNSLPVDQHMLIALVAPRPLYTTNASKDLWADPKGSYLSLLCAQPVYALYEKHSALTPGPPPVNTPVINSILGYHIREGGHDLTVYDWTNFIYFANYHYYHR